jgi:hypothetical protein
MLRFLNRNFSENLFRLSFFYFPFPLCGFEDLQKMSKFYQRQRLNPLSILFHHGLIQILVISHLSKTGDSWESFLLRNNFTLPNNITELPLHLNENPSPCRSNPIVPPHESIQVVPNKSVVKKKGRYAKQSNPDVHFTNKRIKQAGNVIIKNSTNFNTIINSDASLSNI